MFLEGISPYRKNAAVLIFAASFLLSGAVFLAAFRQLPVEGTSLGLDWRTIWEGIQHGQVTFGNAGSTIGGMFTPPWGILYLFPLGFLSFRDSWAIISFATLITLIASVPRLDEKKLDAAGIFLLVLSFPALRNLADGNLEGLVIGGVILIILGYNRSKPLVLSLGILLAAVKFQETWLLCLVVFYLVRKNWSAACQRQAVVVLGAAAIFSLLLWGRDWAAALVESRTDAVGLSSAMGRGTLIDITISAALGRLGLPAWLINAVWLSLLGLTVWLLWRHLPTSLLPRGYAAFLIAASMLLAPYVSGDSFLTVLAVGIIPLLRQNRFMGLVLIALTNLPFLMPKDWLYFYQAYYWSFLLLVVWFVVGRRIATHHLSELTGVAPSISAVQ